MGPLLFLIFINDVVDLFTDNVSVKLYADDVKLYLEITNESDVDILQHSVNKFIAWAQTWQLSLSAHKCLHMRVGLLRSASPFTYRINELELSRVDMIRDLGVYIDNKLSFSGHIKQIVAHAFCRSSQILRCFLSRDNDILIRAFITYVRPNLEYCSPVWSPSTPGLINCLESVQRRFTKKLSGMSALSYDQRCAHLKLERLELRRLRQDLITGFKIIHGLTCLDSEEFFTVDRDHRTRGHKHKLLVPISRIDARKHFFSQRVIKIWNILPPDIVEAASLDIFVNKLRDFNLHQFLLGSL